MSNSPDQTLNTAMGAAVKVIWPDMVNMNATELMERIEVMKRAFDAAFATGAVGMYEKVRGIPKPVPERIIAWMEGVIAQIEMMRIGEPNLGRRMLLTQLYNMSESAQAALNDAKKHNAAHT